MRFEAQVRPATHNPVMPREQMLRRAVLHAAAAAVLLSGAFASATVKGHAAGPPALQPPPPPTSMGPTSMGPGSSGMTHMPASTAGAPSSALQLGPAGRWWDDSGFAKSIGLKQEQQQRMDAVFNANKAALFNTYRSLKAEEAKLDSLQRAESPDEDKILAQIDKVSALRGQLAKQSAALVLQLRKELTPDQIKALEAAQ